MANGNSQSKRWCFTINNYIDEDINKLNAAECSYLVYGREVAPDTGTPHLQGFIIFSSRKRFNTVRAILGERGHYESARASSAQAADYCKKGGDFTERGNCPTGQGARTDIEDLVKWIDDWITERGGPPCREDFAIHQPGSILKYRNVEELARLRCPTPKLRDGEPRPWQRALAEELAEAPDDRSVIFYVDELGGTGKTWFQQWFYQEHPDKVQILAPGSHKDMAYALDPTRSIFFINVARGGMQFLQYRILEGLKDRMVFSEKYESAMKVLLKPTHVVVFSNEMPDRTKMSEDRYVERYNYD
ncbi:MAG: putative viral replication protein [Proteusivirus raitis]|uniref:Putative viral replication protein n=1 Tax=Circoviridae sp. TaxID=1954248 RepID=A0A345MZ67_9VIRU|nr:MAG: putative viral replication protein [Circoviridae sp.]